MTTNVNLIASDFSKVYGTPDQLTATLKAGDTPLPNKTITFTINGVSYNRTTDNNGTAKLNINLNIGSYPTTISFAGDSSYSSASKTITVTVTDKYTTSITASDLTKYYGDSDQLIARLMYNGNGVPGKPIDFIINGVAYTRNTDSNGYARLNINLWRGVYSTTIKFNGDNYYKTSTKTVTVKVISRTTLKTSDLKKRHSELKQFLCQVKDVRNNNLSGNVTFYVNGVTYVRAIDNNGFARLNIRLGEGTYTITSSYSGDAINSSATATNKIIVTPDTDNVTMKENMVTVPPENRGFMESKIYVSLQFLYGYMKSGNYLNPMPDWTHPDNLKHPIQFTSYEITETDPRVKTAKFTSPQYFDLTQGVLPVFITSPYHENFGGLILKVEYDKSTKLYTYQCQDGRREYISKNRFVGNGTVSAYELLEGALISKQYYKGKFSMPISNELREKYKRTLSGLHPVDDYEIKPSEGIAPTNSLKNNYPMMLSFDTKMDNIMNIAHVGQTPTDVYFTPDMICHIDPVDVDRWIKEGLKLVHSDLVHYKYSFDTTNIITDVMVKHSNNSATTYSDTQWDDLRFFFGTNISLINEVTTTSGTTTTGTAQSSGSGLMSGKKTFVVGADNYDDRSDIESQWIKTVINKLTAKGHTCINVGVGPSAVTRYGNKSASKGKIGVFIVNGSDAGMYTDFKDGLKRGYYHYDHMIVVMASNVATTDKWLTCNGMKNTKLVRAHDDNYSRGTPEAVGYTAKDYFNKYSKYISYVCGPLGCTFDSVATNLANGNFGSNGNSTTSVTTNTSNTTTVDEFGTYEKVLEQMSNSIRDLLSFEIRVPLNHPLFKNLHTNQMLHTELPTEFKLGNLEKIFRMLPSYKVNRGVRYQVNRWYVEGVKIKCDSGGLFADITLNPFPSGYSVYANAMKSYADAYNQAFNSSSTITTSNNSTMINNGQGLGTPLLGNDCTETNSMKAMSGGYVGNSGHGKNFDKAAQRGYAKQGANYYNWARQYNNVKDLLHAIASRHREQSPIYRGNRKCPSVMFNNGGTMYSNCYDACRFVKVCCDACGFPCVIITGEVYGWGHGWNAVKYNGTWYTFDLLFVSKGNSTRGTNSFRSVW